MANRVIFKQILQAGAADFLTIDACRVAGVNENIAILLLAAKFGVPVCPHAGGVGLCEMVQHLAMFDYASVSATTEDRVIEYVDHLHEHFTDPVRVVGGRYLAPVAPGFSATLRPASLRDYEFPRARSGSDSDISEAPPSLASNLHQPLRRAKSHESHQSAQTRIRCHRARRRRAARRRLQLQQQHRR